MAYRVIRGALTKVPKVGRRRRSLEGLMWVVAGEHYRETRAALARPAPPKNQNPRPLRADRRSTYTEEQAP